MVPWSVTLGGVWTLRSAMPFSAVAGTDLNGDGAITDLVPGTTRNSGNRDLNLDRGQRLSRRQRARADCRRPDRQQPLQQPRRSRHPDVPAVGPQEGRGDRAGVQPAGHRQPAGVRWRRRLRDQRAVGFVREDSAGGQQAAGGVRRSVRLVDPTVAQMDRCTGSGVIAMTESLQEEL